MLSKRHIRHAKIPCIAALCSLKSILWHFVIFQGNTVYWGGPNEADLNNVVLISDIPITEGPADQGYRGNLSETLKNQLVIICHHSAKEYWRAS